MRSQWAIALALAAIGVDTAAAAPPGAGEEVLAFDPAAVTEVSAAGPKWRIVAHRFDPARERFHIAVFTPGALRVCDGGKGFVSVLDRLKSLRAGRMLSKAATKRLEEDQRAVTLKIVVQQDIDLTAWTFHRLVGVADRVAAQADGMDHAVEMRIPAATFDLLAGGCWRLGR